jgi:two-component system, sensor histidine kinase and response regulator
MANVKQKILVIEDEQSVLHNALEILRLEGFDVQGAENGQLGLQCAYEYLPDLIICDIMMPEMNGYEVLYQLRNSSSTRLTPFIFLTARTERRDMRQGMNLGADDYLTKPFTVAELLESIDARLKKTDVIVDITQAELGKLRENIALSMPHELRTPLTSILGFSEIIVLDGSAMPPDQVVKMAEHIYQAGTRLFRLVENYLTYAQIEIIGLDAKRKEDTLKGVTHEAERIIKDKAFRTISAVQREADLQLDVAPAKLKIHEQNLAKIVEELVDNAGKFSSPGTLIKVTGMTSGQEYVLTISDHGRGMNSDQVKRIGAYRQFDREFYEQQGSGLGLVIAKRLAELHGGSLTIDAVPNQRTTVMVRLALA